MSEAIAASFEVHVCFSRSHRNYTLSADGTVATVNSDAHESWRMVSADVMSASRHYVEFTVLKTWGSPMVGMIRPTYDVEGGCDG